MGSKKTRFISFEVLLILAAIAAVRLLCFFQFKESVYANTLAPDELVYFDWARAIYSGIFKTSQPFFFAPLPAYFFAFLLSLFGESVEVLRSANFIIGLLNCLLIGYLAFLISDKKAALIALCLSGIFGPLILYSIIVLKTTLAVFLFTLTIIFYVKAQKEKSHFIKNVFLFGLFLGLASASRENTLCLITLIVPILISKKARIDKKQVTLASVFVLGVCLSLLPFVALNYQSSKALAITSSQLGANFYIGNTLENDYPFYHPVSFARAFPIDQLVDFRIEADKRNNRKLSASEASTFWLIQGVGELKMQKTLNKLVALFSDFEAGENYNIEYLLDTKALKFKGISLIYILPFAFLGLFFFSKSKILLLPLVLYGLSCVAFFISARYRLPFSVLLIVLASVGLSSLLNEFSLKNISILFLAFLLTLFIEFQVVPGEKDFSAYNNFRAALEQDEGLKILEDNRGRFSDFSQILLSRAKMQVGENAVAKRILESEEPAAYALSEWHFARAELYARQKLLAPAISELEKAIKINSGHAPARTALGKVYSGIDKEKAREQSDFLFNIRSYYQ